MVLVDCVVAKSHVTYFKYVTHVNVALFSKVISLPKSFVATHAQWNLGLMEGRPRDWGNWFVTSRVRYVEVLSHTLHYYWSGKYRLLCRGLCCVKVR